MSKFVDKFVTATARAAGASFGCTVIFGFFNWVGMYGPMTHEPANLYLVAWVAFIAAWDWPKDV